MGLVAAFAVPIAVEAGGVASFAGRLAMTFFVAGSVMAMVLGRRIDSVGPRRCAIACGVSTAVVALPLLSIHDEPVAMVIGCAVSGAAFALTLPATNAVLQEHLPARLLVVAVCAKQAAIPLALLLAATVAPLLSRSTASQAAAVVAFISVGLFAVVTTGAEPTRARDEELPPLPTGDAAASLVRFGAVILLASLAAGALIGYSALALSDLGMSEAAVARTLVAANLGGVAVRILSGVTAARYDLTSWWPVSSMMLAGAVGLVGMATGRPALVVGGCLCAFAFGWGWSGLAFAIVLVDSSGRPGASGAHLQASGMLGSALGPGLMAAAISVAGLATGWLLVAVVLAVAGGLACWPRASST